MTDEVKTTPEAEVKAPAEAPTEEKKEQTIAEALEVTPVKEEPKVETVGLDKFLKEKAGRREAEKQLKSLRESIEDGATKAEISSTVEAIADEHNIDKPFLNKLVATIKAETEKDFEDKLSSRLKPIEEKEKAEKIGKAFTEHYAKAIEEMPEFKDISNPEVIKTLSLDPKNAQKTFKQIIEETYGNAIGGKRSIETTIPRGGKEPEPLDVARAAKDGAYFAEVMANPKLKAEYNKQMLLKGF